ncbi:unnamed protein product [Prorocentrum cordatum]|uniref:Uncharacterized protein n=1 Tax=Prorocentrum cordatum TaxID=2364126 RepID=A0ABN9XLN1_9DINO|nr:unnamed protein product [Polarella glacialis]
MNNVSLSTEALQTNITYFVNHIAETVDGVANELHGAPSRPDTAPPPPAWFLPSSGGVRACERADRRGGRGGGKAAD